MTLASLFPIIWRLNCLYILVVHLKLCLTQERRMFPAGIGSYTQDRGAKIHKTAGPSSLFFFQEQQLQEPTFFLSRAAQPASHVFLFRPKQSSQCLVMDESQPSLPSPLVVMSIRRAGAIQTEFHPAASSSQIPIRINAPSTLQPPYQETFF